MKFSKLMLLCTGLVLTSSLIAAESEDSFPFGTHKCREEKKESHSTYLGYEWGSQGVSHPSIGHRYQNGSYIFDVNGGYKYVKTVYSPLHFGKVGVNIFKSIHSTEKGQLYAGVGTDLVGVKTRSYYGRREKDYALHPSASIGHDFNLDDNKKVFFELSYKPYAFGKYENTSIHHVGCRMGIGF